MTAQNRRSLALLKHSSRPFSAETAEYAKRNYASNISEYNTVISSLIAQRRNYLLRDAYDDMLLDGVQPVRDTFHSLIVGTMKCGRLQDGFFFREQMNAMGLHPDVGSPVLFAPFIFYCTVNSGYSCGLVTSDRKSCRFRSFKSWSLGWKGLEEAFLVLQLLEEMKRHGVKLKGETYICLLNACAATGRTDQVYAIVRDMTAAGLGLNKFCYAGLITGFKNKLPITKETTTKTMETILEMLKRDGYSYDIFIVMQAMRQ